MKTMLAALSLALAFSTTVSAQNVNSDEIPAGLVIEDLAGDYKNAQGDTAKIEVTREPSDDLFRKEYTAYMTLKFVDSTRDFELDINNIRLEQDGSYSLSRTLECEDPGCEAYELSVNIVKTPSGAYELSADVTYEKVIDDEEAPTSDEEAKDMCSWLVGKNDVIEVTWDENGVICGFSGSMSNLVK